VKIVSINERVLPDLTDEWAAGITAFPTIDELKVGLREQMEQEVTRTSDEVAINRVVEALIERSTIEFPRIMVQREVERDLNRLATRLDEQGATYEDYLDHNKLTQEEHRAQLAERAEDRVRTRLVIRELTRKEQVVITDDEVDSELGRLLDENDIETKDARRLMKSERHRDQVETMITQRKINDLLRRIATINDVPVPEREGATESA
jgi:trigger factor